MKQLLVLSCWWHVMLFHMIDWLIEPPSPVSPVAWLAATTWCLLQPPQVVHVQDTTVGHKPDAGDLHELCRLQHPWWPVSLGSHSGTMFINLALCLPSLLQKGCGETGWLSNAECVTQCLGRGWLAELFGPAFRADGRYDAFQSD